MTLSDAIKALEAAGIDYAEYDARELMRKFSGNESQLITKATECDSPEFLSALERRISREPLGYILGTVGFFREEYKVTPDCLIPRPDTEILVEYAVKSIPCGSLFLDLCSGSGCIGISTLANTLSTECISVDISEKALDLTLENAKRNGVSGRLRTLKCDLLNDTPVLNKKPFAILSNPPYIKPSVYEELSEEVHLEPRIAFVAEDDGMAFYNRLVPMAMDMICGEGFAAFEIGYDQKEAITKVAEKNGCSIEIIKDYSGNDRVAVIRKIQG